MPSPFPGMDPYLEASGSWENFHNSFLTYTRDVLLDAVPSEYDVNIQDRVASISAVDGESKRAVLDVGISSTRGHSTDGPSASGGIATLEAGTVRVEHTDFEPLRETYLEILHRPEQRLVTVIELLSPSNKEKLGSNLYRAKREALLVQYVHIVEIDLLQRGTRLSMKKPLPAGDYFAYITRAQDRFFAEVIHWTIRQALPTIPIPLSDPDPDIRLDLAALFRFAYAQGKYHRKLNYKIDPPSFLRPDDQEWARGIVANPA